MEVVMQVSRWGNSLAVRLPKKLVDDMRLVEGDKIDIVEALDRTLFIEKDQRRKRALENMRVRGWSAPADYKFDRDEANER
jgi:antitoxin MazE